MIILGIIDLLRRVVVLGINVTVDELGNCWGVVEYLAKVLEVEVAIRLEVVERTVVAVKVRLTVDGLGMCLGVVENLV